MRPVLVVHVMTTQRNLTIVAFLLATALGCDDFAADDIITVECDGNDCWADSPNWDAQAQATTETIIADAEDVGAWVPTREVPAGDQCWLFAGSDAHLCTVSLDGVLLLGRPASELPLTPAGNACWFGGAWESNAEAYGQCFGILDGVAVQLAVL